MPAHNITPCPFCGGESGLRRAKQDSDYWYVECGKCFSRQLASPSAAEAARSWNRRAVSGHAPVDDRQALIEVFDRLGVGYENKEHCVELREGMAKVQGYWCFYTLFEFDANGKFETVGAYE